MVLLQKSHQFDAFGQRNDAYSSKIPNGTRLAGGGEIDLGAATRLAFDIGYTELTRESYGFSFPPPDFLPTPSVTDYETDDLYASARLHVGVNDHWDVIAGVDRLRQSMVSPTIDESSTLLGAHVQALAAYGDMSFDGTVRFESQKYAQPLGTEEQLDYDSIFTWRLAAAYVSAMVVAKFSLLRPLGFGRQVCLNSTILIMAMAS